METFQLIIYTFEFLKWCPYLSFTLYIYFIYIIYMLLYCIYMFIYIFKLKFINIYIYLCCRICLQYSSKKSENDIYTYTHTHTHTHIWTSESISTKSDPTHSALSQQPKPHFKMWLTPPPCLRTLKLFLCMSLYYLNRVFSFKINKKLALSLESRLCQVWDS